MKKDITEKLAASTKVNCCTMHGPSHIPQEGKYDQVYDLRQLSGFSHSVGTCAPKQGACKLTLNVKDGIIAEALVEVLGCSGMTQSAAMAAEILPGKTLLEALNTDLACDAINVAMREMFLALAYGRTQTAFSDGGLPVGAGLDDLGAGLRSQVGTSYGTIEKGPRYLELTEGYVLSLGLDEQGRIIGYKYVHIGRMMDLIKDGLSADEALEKTTGIYGRYNEAVTFIDPRRE
jgi:NifU-like protein involved in Fe-S cluster formation